MLLIMVSQFYLYFWFIGTIKIADPISSPPPTYVAASACYGDYEGSGHYDSGDHDDGGCND